ncbi:MAG: hypothetical protein ABI824_05410 [Acidobacteriota bacterium]
MKQVSEAISFAGQALCLAAAMLLTGCAQSTSDVRPVFKGVVPINDIMVDVIDHNSHMIWNAAAPEKAPKTDQDWHALEHAAVTLAASGNMILIPGPPKDDQVWVADPQWQKFAQDLTNAGEKAVLAVSHRDMAAISMAGDDLVATCEACHQKFKPALPAHVAKPEEQPEHFGKYDQKK